MPQGHIVLGSLRFESKDMDPPSKSSNGLFRLIRKMSKAIYEWAWFISRSANLMRLSDNIRKLLFAAEIGPSHHDGRKFVS